MENPLFSMPPESEARLHSCTNLPSPPKVALRIIQLAKDPNIDVEDVARILSIDPALSTKILGMANSALYGHQKKVNNLQKATMVIGFNGVLSLALSFSLVKSLRREQGEGLNQIWFWRRALTAGAACRALGEACHRKDLEELFTAAFIQDIGMLALDQIDSTLYVEPDFNPSSHLSTLAREVEKFGANHNVVGSWLLSQWNFPEELVLAVRYSDEPDQVPPGHEHAQFFQCVSLSGLIAELIADLHLTQTSDEMLHEISRHIEAGLRLGPQAFLEIIKTLKGMIGEVEALFEIESQGEYDLDSILEKARELLVLRNIKLDQQINTLSANV